MENLLLLSILISGAVTFISLPAWIKRAKKGNLTGKDVHKIDKRDVAEAGGISVIIGFILGILTYIAIKTFYFQSNDNIIEIFAIICTIIFVSFIGFVDDILGWKIGLNKKTRLILVFFAAIPLMVINAGYSEIMLPFVGKISLGIIYPLILIPLGVVGASTTFNFIAGYNGLEAGQGIIILSSLAIFSFITGTTWLSLVALCMVASLMSFMYFNKFPSQVFPGDSLTYGVGALIACMAILGNYEQFAIFIFSPYIIETLLKTRGKLRKESFGVVQEDGSIKNRYKKIYGLEHLAIKILEKIKKSGKVYEVEIVLFIYLIQVIFVILGLLIFVR